MSEAEIITQALIDAGYLEAISDETFNLVAYVIQKELDALKECQLALGADDICGLPESSPVHLRTPQRGHRFVSATERKRREG